MSKKINSIKTYLSWAYVGYKDIIMRYRRTVLGPFWLVLATAITISGMTVVNVALFKAPVLDSLLHVSSGMIVWLFISSLVTDSAYTFLSHASLIKNVNVSYSCICLRVFTRDFIIFLHNVFVFIAILIFSGKSFSVWNALFFVWIVVFFVIFMSLCYSLGFLSARFRDIPQLITSILVVSSFLTPILWRVDMMGDMAVWIYLNPFVHFLDLMRNSLIGIPPVKINVYVALIAAVLNVLVAWFLHKRLSSHARLWL